MIELWEGDLEGFREAVAWLGPDERFELSAKCDPDFLLAALNLPEADRIDSLQWDYTGERDVKRVAAKLPKKLASLDVTFRVQPEIDFVVAALKVAKQIQKLKFWGDVKGDFQSFFNVMETSMVTHLVLSPYPEMDTRLIPYLQSDRLVELELDMVHYNRADPQIAALKDCVHLTSLTLSNVQHAIVDLTKLPTTLTRLCLFLVKIWYQLDWSFLNGLQVKDLALENVAGMRLAALEQALTAHLRRMSMDELKINFELQLPAEALSKVKRLDVKAGPPMVQEIADAIQKPNTELKALFLTATAQAVDSIETYIRPALRHPNCELTELRLRPETATTKLIEFRFNSRRALLVLLQGQQIRRLHSPLRRLPVEMFRMVGMVLL